MPFKSEAQRKWAHTKEGTKALGGKKAVEEWERATKRIEQKRWHCQWRITQTKSHYEKDSRDDARGNAQEWKNLQR